MKQRGVFEKEPGSGVWWIRYADASGHIRREIAGPKSTAISLYQKRKTEIRQGKKLPESLRTKAITFSDLAESALAYSRGHKRSYKDDECRMRKIRDKFDYFVAEEVNPEDLECWLESHGNWTVATKNRYLALLKLAYRLGEKNRKIKVNPARLVRMRRENNERVRYLNQHEPLPTKQNYLKGCKDEESRLLAVIKEKASFHLPEFLIALHTGMRRSEQYAMEWQNVNFERKLLNVTRSKKAAAHSAEQYRVGGIGVSAAEHGHRQPSFPKPRRPQFAAGQPSLVRGCCRGGRCFRLYVARFAPHICESSRHGGCRHSGGARPDGTQDDQHDRSVRPP
jgi:integrase